MAKREQLMDEIRGSWQRASDLRKNVIGLELSGRTDAHVGVGVRQLLDEAQRFECYGIRKTVVKSKEQFVTIKI